MKAVVFAGPSLFGLRASVRADVDLRPPAKSGDLMAAVLDGATVIGLVDGVFGFVPSVWHKEILAALDAGVRVYGAASMGALRAAECHTFGMQGIGQVFQDYRDGVREADADVAVLHAPAELDFQPLTIALVDVDATVERLLNRNKISTETAEAVRSAARRRNFRTRTWPTILMQADLAENDLATFEALNQKQFISQKQRDCQHLIEVVKGADSDRTSASLLRNGPLSRTDVLVRLEHKVSQSHRCKKRQVRD